VEQQAVPTSYVGSWPCPQILDNVEKFGKGHTLQFICLEH